MAVSITNPRGAYGGQVTGAGGADPFKAASAITALAVVNMDGTGGGVSQATTSSAPGLARGVALSSAVAGDTVMVRTRGFVAGVPADGAIAAGAAVKRSATTAGRVQDAGATPAVGESLGFALGAASGGKVNIWIV